MSTRAAPVQAPPDGALLDRTSAFSYRCARCSRCCPRYSIQVNPYEILRLARLLGVSTTEFARTYLADGPYLRRRQDGACPFLQEGTGCSVHAARPLVCRLYPLGRHVGASGEEAFSVLTPVEGSLGLAGREGTVEGYLAEQGAKPFLAAADLYLALFRRLWIGLERHDDPPALPVELLDVDAWLAKYGTAAQGAPSDDDTSAALHVRLIETWAKAHLTGGRS